MIGENGKNRIKARIPEFPWPVSHIVLRDLFALFARSVCGGGVGVYLNCKSVRGPREVGMFITPFRITCFCLLA